jgi:aryl-alcohol dehydrogenase-like predicted oxidoreductase
MRMRPLGNSGMLVSAVGLGCNQFGATLDAGGTRAVVDAAIDCGITFFDTAEIYGDTLSERFLGDALGKRRGGVVIATKFGWVDHGVPEGSAVHVRTAIEGSLSRLGTDYIDLYQYHHKNPDVPFAETLGTLGELVQEGKVRHIGSSNSTAGEVREARAIARANAFPEFVSEQSEYSLLARDAEQELIPALDDLGLGLLPYFPLLAGC